MLLSVKMSKNLLMTFLFEKRINTELFKGTRAELYIQKWEQNFLAQLKMAKCWCPGQQEEGMKNHNGCLFHMTLMGTAMLKHRKVNSKGKWEMSIYCNNLLLPKGLTHLSLHITIKIKCLILQKSCDSHTVVVKEMKIYLH